MTHWTDRLRDLGACRKAIDWAKAYPTLAEAWTACERADWMLWLLGRTCGARGSEAHRALVLTACACARTVLHLVRAGEDRPRIAIETTEQWARGENGVTLADVRAYAAYAAYAAAYAAYASADAADASASASAYAAADSAYAAYASADAADAADAAYAEARTTHLRTLADLIRTRHEAPTL